MTRNPPGAAQKGPAKAWESARNIDTYLGAVDKETVREMLRTLIREVLVGPGAATLRYTIPMPSGGPGKNTMTEDIILG